MTREILGDLTPLKEPEFKTLVEEIVAARERELATSQADTHGPVSSARPLGDSLVLFRRPRAL